MRAGILRLSSFSYVLFSFYLGRIDADRGREEGIDFEKDDVIHTLFRLDLLMIWAVKYG